MSNPISKSAPENDPSVKRENTTQEEEEEKEEEEEEEEEEEDCNVCGEFVGDRITFVCSFCKHDTLCSSCSEECYECGEQTCLDCLDYCKECDKHVCTHCIYDTRCKECRRSSINKAKRKQRELNKSNKKSKIN
jgi:hypothetical protein